jgi:hypothetical protein
VIYWTLVRPNFPVFSINPSTITYHTGPGSHGEYGLYAIPVMGGGALPFSFAYEYNTTPNTPSTGSWMTLGSALTNYTLPTFSSQVLMEYSLTTGQIHISNGGGGGGKMVLRLTVTGPYGSSNIIAGTSTFATFTYNFSHSS